MNKLLILLKANIINTLNLNKFKKKDTGRYSPWAILLVVFIVFLVYGFAFLYLFIFGDLFASQGFPQLILVLGLMAGVMAVFLTSLTTANGYLFRSKDFDMLMALPVRPRTVFASKLFYLLLINYITLSFVYYPTIIVYAVYNPTDWLFYLLFIPVFFLMPLLFITVASLLSYLIGFLTAKLRYKNIISLVLTIGLLISIMYLSFKSSVIDEDPSKFTEDINLFLNKIKMGNLIYQSLLGDYLNLLIFVGFSIIPFGAFVYLVGQSYVKASLRSRVSYTRKNFKMTTLKKSTQNKALYKREVKRYFSSNVYVMNTLVGPILSTIVLVLMAINSKAILEGLPVEASSSEMLPFVLTAIFSFMLGITSSTACSLSMEGKQFWIIRTAPVQEKQIFNAKIFVNLLISVPFIVLNTVIANFIFDLTIFDSLFMIAIPSLLAYYMSVLGIFVNILFPRFDYENETKIVKQSVSVLITMIFGFIGSALVLVPGFLIYDASGNVLFGYLLELGIEVLLIAIVMVLLSSVGIKKYKKLIS
ncbi:MAG: ABC transporter permease [Bacilli bacterium]|nr:ABC transporter permease [Bacilli bacterium]